MNSQLPVTVIPQRDFAVPDAVEDGLTFVENALIKARHAAQLTNLPALANDSGLCVDILDGAPGIHSARYAGEPSNDARNNEKLLAALTPYRNGQPITAQFICCLVAVRYAKDPLPLIAVGRWQGEVLPIAQGEGGFGYDPLFWLPDQQCTSAALPPDLKNQFSHRGQAMQALIAQWSEYFPKV